MNNTIKLIIEEEFKSKKQQRYFFAKANDESLSKKEREQWKKWANEYSDDTDYDEIPDEVKEGGVYEIDLTDEESDEELDEIVDSDGNIQRSKKPTDFVKKGITIKSTSTTDKVAKTGAGSMPTHGLHGTHTALRNWVESDLSKVLGFKDTLANDDDYEEAKDHFEKELNLDDKEIDDRMGQIGYDKKLPEDKVRLIENPKSYIKNYLETIIDKKSTDPDIISKEPESQIQLIRDIIKKNGLTKQDIIDLL
jgi:hypothetical protein